MTHSLHRRGTYEELSNDFVVLAMGARGINRDECAPKIKQILAIMTKYNPVNYGDVFTGNSITSQLKNMAANIRDNTVAHAVYRSEADLVGLLAELKQEDLGISIVVSGLFDRVHECCQRAQLSPHTINASLGIFGKTDKLPAEPFLEVATMCGHGMIAFNLVKKVVSDITKGTLTCRKGAEKLAVNCHCGVFNIERAESILKRLVTTA